LQRLCQNALKQYVNAKTICKYVGGALLFHQWFPSTFCYTFLARDVIYTYNIHIIYTYSTGMGDRLRAGIPPRYVTKPTRSTHPCIPPGSLNRVPALTGWDKGGNVTSAGWQVTWCDFIWHVSSRSGEACCKLLYPITYLFTY